MQIENDREWVSVWERENLRSRRAVWEEHCECKRMQIIIIGVENEAPYAHAYTPSKSMMSMAKR